MFYGQFDPPTDSVIARFFPAGFVGSCVEVGAVDGRHMSNTLYFEEAGWKCLCIEPNEHYHEALRMNRKHFLPYAVSSRNQDGVVLHRVKIGDAYDACTSLELDQTLISQFKRVINEQDEILVNARTLDSCMEEAGFSEVDFVTIDTEGTELSVLQGFDIARWKPALVVIENNHDTPRVDAHLLALGYPKILNHAVNDFYMRVLAPRRDGRDLASVVGRH